ncbi:ATP-binding protein [Pseudomonas sp.]|uniref:ATP-binding protein n=1 Tax=Pseudomonas sp. TaxID=306 RepID=UPI003264E024
MICEIEQFLRVNPGSKAKEIARHLGTDRRSVNVVLYEHEAIFVKDEEDCWSLVNGQNFTIVLKKEAWVGSSSFEDVLALTGSPLETNCAAIEFVLPKGCKIMIDAVARMLALCNQLVMAGKKVSIDFSACRATLTYCNRLGFFDYLNISVEVIPARPPVSTAKMHNENNDGVVELAAIDPFCPDESVPKRLKRSFVSCVGEGNSQAAFTFISELFGNVGEHSKSEIPGFAALQYYKNGRSPKIQTVISDSGIGIVGSLLPVLERKHPEIFKQLDFTKPESGPQLVLRVFQQGRISSVEDDARGLGLKASGDAAATFGATVTVRQKNFELTMVYEGGKLSRSSNRLNMPTIFGTHICFEFLVDS